MGDWTIATMPSQKGKRAVVTGPTSGVGLYTAIGLAKAEAEVILAARNLKRANEVVTRIKDEVPAANVVAFELDLASLASIHRFAQTLTQNYRELDLLINNAGIAAVPYQRTQDGFEMQIGVNHLGHFALTGLLLPLLIVVPAPRVVTVTSLRQNKNRINFDDLQSTHRYRRITAYLQSKLANMLFAAELQRRAEAVGSTLKSLSCQPGYTATNLGSRQQANWFERGAIALGNKVLAHSAEVGALSSLYAATVPDLPSGSYISPSGFGNIHGTPQITDPGKAAHNQQAAQRLWQVSEELTSVNYDWSKLKVAL